MNNNKNKKKFYTTGDVARYCEVNVNTVKRWIRQEKLPAFSTPSGHYRIERDKFISFIKDQGFTYDPTYFGEDEHKTDILIIENDQRQLDFLFYLLTDLYKDLLIDSATDGFNGYMKIRQQKPKLVLLDLRSPELTGLELLRVMRSCEDMKKVKVLIISNYLNESMYKELDKFSIDGVIDDPFNRKELKEKCDIFLKNAKVQKKV